MMSRQIIGGKTPVSKRGEGCIIGRPGTKNLYIRYYAADGHQVQESLGKNPGYDPTSREDAQKLLTIRLHERQSGARPLQDVRNVKYDDIRDSYIADNPPDAPNRTKLGYLNAFFGGMPIVKINADTLREFTTEKRDKDLLSDPTIRRILVLLRAMFNQAQNEGKIRETDVPYFPMPADSKPRQGFAQPDVFAKLHDALPQNLRPLIKFCYVTGTRIGTATKIRWSMVNADCTEIAISGDITKNGKPLTLPLVGPLAEISTMLKKLFRDESKPVFSHRALRRGWCVTCHALGLGIYDEKTRKYSGLTIHDLRRSATRNLIRAGVDRGTAMSITGHLTEAVFERYSIKTTDDKKEALLKVGEYTKQVASRAANSNA